MGSNRDGGVWVLWEGRWVTIYFIFFYKNKTVLILCLIKNSERFSFFVSFLFFPLEDKWQIFYNLIILIVQRLSFRVQVFKKTVQQLKIDKQECTSIQFQMCNWAVRLTTKSKNRTTDQIHLQPNRSPNRRFRSADH